MDNNQYNQVLTISGNLCILHADRGDPLAARQREMSQNIFLIKCSWEKDTDMISEEKSSWSCQDKRILSSSHHSFNDSTDKE